MSLPIELQGNNVARVRFRPTWVGLWHYDEKLTYENQLIIADRYDAQGRREPHVAVWSVEFINAVSAREIETRPLMLAVEVESMVPGTLDLFEVSCAVIFPKDLSQCRSAIAGQSIFTLKRYYTILGEAPPPP